MGAGEGWRTIGMGSGAGGGAGAGVAYDGLLRRGGNRTGVVVLGHGGWSLSRRSLMPVGSGRAPWDACAAGWTSPGLLVRGNCVARMVLGVCVMAGKVIGLALGRKRCGLVSALSSWSCCMLNSMFGTLVCFVVLGELQNVSRGKDLPWCMRPSMVFFQRIRIQVSTYCYC